MYVCIVLYFSSSNTISWNTPQMVYLCSIVCYYLLGWLNTLRNKSFHVRSTHFLDFVKNTYNERSKPWGLSQKLRKKKVTGSQQRNQPEPHIWNGSLHVGLLSAPRGPQRRLDLRRTLWPVGQRGLRGSWIPGKRKKRFQEALQVCLRICFYLLQKYSTM